MLSGRKDDRLKSWLSEAVDATESSTNTLVKSYPSEDSIKGGDSVSQLHSVKSLDNLSPPAHRELDQSLLQTDETLAYVPSHASSDSNQSSPVPVRPTSAAHPSSSANVKELPSHKAKAFQDRTSVQHPSVSHRLDLLAANDKEEMKALNQPPPRLHASRIIDRPDPVDSDAKSAYNAKSARGGRGGQVTSVAHLWSQLSGGQSGATIPADMLVSFPLLCVYLF